MKDKIHITRTEEKSEDFGFITKIEFPDNSSIYLSDNGVTLRLPRSLKHILRWIKKGCNFEITADWGEMALVLKEEEIRRKKLRKSEDNK